MSGGRDWVAVDIDATLTDRPFVEGQIAALTDSGRRLLEQLKLRGFKVLLFTGHMNEDRLELEKNVALVEAWVRAQGIEHLVERVWPFPKPHVRAFIDDRAVRWRGDVDMSVLETENACEYGDAKKEKP